MSKKTIYERLGGYDAISDEKWRDDPLAFTAKRHEGVLG